MGAFAAGGMAALPGCATAGSSGDDGMAKRTFFYFDTVCTVQGAMDKSLLNTLEERCKYFEGIFSATIETSDVSKINAAAGEPVEVAPETADLITRSLAYSVASDGLFDITIGAVSLLWDFKEGIVPASADIEAALPHIDYRTVSVDGNTVQLADPKARIDLGGIAKGYIADDLLAILVENGITSACVNLGGNVAVLGAKPDGTPWNIGVRMPESGSEEVAATIKSKGGSLVTSGLYERRFEVEGREYWHILDPRTGYPVESDIVSASIYAEASIDGDGFTKPLFMMGQGDALAFLEKQRLQGLLIATDGSIATTSGSHFVY
jgi:thiamine biosynthesis lipoprotein